MPERLKEYGDWYDGRDEIPSCFFCDQAAESAVVNERAVERALPLCSSCDAALAAALIRHAGYRWIASVYRLAADDSLNIDRKEETCYICAGAVPKGRPILVCDKSQCMERYKREYPRHHHPDCACRLCGL